MTKRVIRGISGMILMLVAGSGTPEAWAQCTANITVLQNPMDCSTQVVLEATVSDPVQSWNFTLDGVSVGNGSFVVLDLAPGVYNAGVVAITDQGCTAIDNISFTVVGNPFLVTAGSDVVSCQQQAMLVATVSSTDPYSIHWYPEQYLENPDTHTPTVVQNVDNQWFVVEVVDAVTGCVNSDTVYVTQQNPVIGTFDLCSGQAVIDLGPGAETYDWLSWTDTLGTNHPLNYPTTQQSITVSEPGQYFAVAYFQECGALTSLVTVEACPQPCWNAFTQNVFPDQCGDLYEFVSTGSGQLTSWSWDFGDGTTSPFPNPYHIFTTGTYEVTLTTTNTDGCTAVSSMIFTSSNGVSLTMSNDTIGCQEAGYMQVFPTGGSGDYSYEWTPAQGTFSDPTQPIFYVEGVHQQVYYAYVTDNVTGCMAYDSVTVSSYVVHNETLELCNDSVFIHLGPGANFYNLAPFSLNSNLEYTWADDTGTFVFYADFPSCGALTSTYHIIPCQTPTCSSEFIHVLTPQGCGALVDFAGSNFSSPVDSVHWDYGNGETYVDGGVGELHYFAPGTYTVTTTAYHANGCVSTYSETFTVVPNFSVDLVTDTVACNGSFQTDHVISGGSGNYIYHWYPATLMNDPFAEYPTVNVATDTWVSVIVEDTQTGCVAVDSVYLYANNPMDQTLQLCTDSAFLEVNPGSLIYQWSYTDAFGNASQLSGTGNSAWAENAGTYICLSFYPGCNTITHTFIVEECTAQNSEVWPGDANNDNVVTNADALYLGLAFNQTGPVRPAATLNWVGQPCPDWNFNFTQNNVNLKHADCDGNGIINFDDTLAISLNYLNTHNKTEGATTGGNPPIWVEAMPDTVGLQQAIDIVVHLGTASQPVDSLHGVAFSLTFNGLLVTQSGFTVDFDNCVLGTAGSDVLTFQKNLFNEGALDLAVTRNTLQNFQGHGPIVHARIVTTDNLSGIAEMPIGVAGVVALTASETVVELTAIGDTVVIDPNRVGVEEQELAKVVVYPNPSSDVLTIAGLPKGASIELMDMLGQQVSIVRNAMEDRVLLNVSDLRSGAYQLRVVTQHGVVTRSVQVVHQ